MGTKLVRNRLLRILKFLGKALLSLLVLFILIVLLIHTPIVQQKITRKISAILSAKTEGKIDIRKIEFSILGNVAMEGLDIRDKNDTRILSADKLLLTSSLFDLLSGDYIFDEVRLEGVDGHLVQGRDGLNIQFILDAFTSTAKEETPSKKITLQINKVLLKDIDFEYTSVVDGMTIEVRLGKFSSDHVEYSTLPNLFRADKAAIEQIGVSILSVDSSVVAMTTEIAPDSNFFYPDFGIGFGLDIGDLAIRNGDFSFHQNQVTETPKFDPTHISLADIQISLKDILLRSDTLGAQLNSLSTQLPGFGIREANSDIRMNRSRLMLSGLHLTSDASEIKGDLTGWYDHQSATTDDQMNLSLVMNGSLDPDEIGYFLSDEIMSYISQWKTANVLVEADYVQGSGRLKSLMLETSNSQLTMSGTIRDIWDAEKFSWEELAVTALIGSDFNSTIAPLLGDIKLPAGIQLTGISTGSTKSLFVDGKVLSAWGNLNAKGVATPMVDNIRLDMRLTGQRVRMEQWLELPWLGLMDVDMDIKGIVGSHQDADIKGKISSIGLMDQTIHDIAFHGTVFTDSLVGNVTVGDPDYLMELYTELSFAGPLIAASEMEVSDFNLGKLLQLDSSLFVTGNLSSKVKMDEPSLEASVRGSNLVLLMQSRHYALDTMALDVLISPNASNLVYFANDGYGTMSSNFDLRDIPAILKPRIQRIVQPRSAVVLSEGNNLLDFDFHLDHADPIRLLGFDVDDFSALHITGRWDEQKQTAMLEASSGRFAGYGIRMDTMVAQLHAVGDSLTSGVKVNNLYYSTFELGNLDFDIRTTGDTSTSGLRLVRDSITLLGIHARILPTDTAVILFPDKLMALGNEYRLDLSNRIILQKQNVELDNVLVTRNDMQLSINGDVQAFTADFRNLDLTHLNLLLPPDSAIINQGHITGVLSYKTGQQLDLKAHVDSLRLYQSLPLTIDVTAQTDENKVPFTFLLSNATNTVNVKGQYLFDSEEIDATLALDVDNLEMFSFLVSDYVDEMDGAVKGEATIRGPLTAPEVKGYARFKDVGFKTIEPKFAFLIEDDVIRFDGAGITLDSFTLYDENHRPLNLSGKLNTKDYKSYTYDLKINTDEFTLIDVPPTSGEKVKGLFVVGAAIDLEGNEADTYVKANITIKNATSLIYEIASEEGDLLKTEGIIEFVDPGMAIDSAIVEHPVTYYDSLITSLPDFNLNAMIVIQDSASLKVITNAQSGDFFEASGAAKLELGYDRTGNLHLSGIYTINQGVYRVSFYDLVKKNFQMIPGSSVSWSGTPETGELDVKAIHKVASNSIGLIAHEVGENEKSAYKRSLEYEVGINIKGTVEKPIVTFSLDLPPEEKTNYPVLANKLDRLRLPEFQTELNKQVFGLLVLGGFLPETTGADINSNQIATTALYNSVNSLLASQLNRFAGQYIKGVNIDVGIQSYADYSTPGGKTQTAMDFRVSKSLWDERLSIEIGGDFDLNSDQSGANTGDNYRGDVAIIYDLTGNGDKQLKLFNNETYDIIYQEIRNTGISLIFIREFDKGTLRASRKKKAQ
jgi:translocation and assembly module TamB